MPESTFGVYRELTRIAVGGSAEVFKARDSRTGELVALKVMLPRSGPTEGFDEEARLQQQLRHPNLVAVREHGVVDGQPYLALEYVDGPSLAAVLATRRLSAATAVHVAVHVLEALSAVHRARGRDGAPLDVVHRDVTPQNIMFDADGSVKLGDFGIARSRLANRTRTGMIKGKLGYLAPEQVTQSAVDARTDLYQVGLVLFEMLCGVPYFGEMSELDLLRAAEAPEVKQPSSFGAPVALDAIVAKALKRFPEERYASADAFARELAAVASALGPPDLGFLTTVAARPPERRPRGSAWMLVVAACVTLVGGAAAMFARRQVTPLASPVAVALTAAPTEVQTPISPPAPPPVTIEAPSGPPRKTRPAKREPTVTPLPEPTAAPEPEPPRDVLAPCLERLGARGIAIVDLPAPLRRDVTDPSADKAELCERLDAVTVDRAFVERKLARLQGAIDRLPPDDPRRPASKGIVRDTLQTLLDGNVARTNEKLRELEKILAR